MPLENTDIGLEQFLLILLKKVCQVVLQMKKQNSKKMPQLELHAMNHKWLIRFNKHSYRLTIDGDRWLYNGKINPIDGYFLWD